MQTPEEKRAAKAAYSRKWYEANKQKVFEYQNSRRELTNDLRKKRRACDPEKYRAKERARYVANRDHIAERSRVYQRDPVRMARWNENRRKKRAAHSKRVFKCAICGCGFSFDNTKGKHLYCSVACRTVAALRVKSKWKESKKAEHVFTCKVCSTEFLRTGVYRKAVQCCSVDCREKAARERNTKWTVNKYRSLMVERPLTCVACLGEYSITSKGTKEKRLYCSETCRAKGRASYKANYRARKRSAPGVYSPSDIEEIFNKQGGCCAACKKQVSKEKGRDKYHVDHVVALVNGGTNWPSNLQVLCRRCNTSKGGRDYAEWLRKTFSKTA